MSEHPKVKMGANMAAKQARKLEREAMVTAGEEEVLVPEAVPDEVVEEPAAAPMPESEAVEEEPAPE